MKFFDILKTANQNLFRNKSRSLLTILAIFIGSVTIILSTAINTGVNDFIDKQVEAAGGDGYLEIAPKAVMEQMSSMMGGDGKPVEYNPDKNSSEMAYITPEVIDKFNQIDGLFEATAFKSIEIEYVTSDKTDKKYLISGNELPTNSISVDLTAGRSVDTKSSDYEINPVPGLSEALGYENDDALLDQTIILAIKDRVTGEITNLEATVVGTQAPSVVSMGRSWINPALNSAIYDVMTAHLPEQMKDRATFASAKFDPAISDEKLAEIKTALSDLGFEGITIEDQIGMMKTFFNAITTVFSVFGYVALVAASIGIINTLFMAVQERTREIGLSKAMGMSSAKIFLSFSIEAIMLGFWGSAIGILLSVLIGSAGNTLAHNTFLADFPTFTLAKFTVPDLLIITAVIMFIAFLAGTLPARRAAKQNPIDALRYE